MVVREVVFMKKVVLIGIVAVLLLAAIAITKVEAPKPTPSTNILFSLKCGWMGMNAISECTPPSCPEGFTDLGTGCSIVDGDYDGNWYIWYN